MRSRGRGASQSEAPDHLADDPEPDQEEVARAIVLRQLAAAPKSRRQLEEKLAARNVPAEVAASVLDRFEEVQLVDDAVFAQMWVRSRQRSRGLARGALRRELQQKGITGDQAEEALEEISDDQEREAALELIHKKLRGTSVPAGSSPGDRAERDKAVRRLSGILARKGYAPGMALGLVREVLDAQGQDDSDLVGRGEL